MLPAQVRSIHWLAPTTIILALTIGSLSALGHDLFYTSLDRDAVATDSYHIAGKGLPKQQFNSTVGVAFALLFKTSMSIAVSTGYAQFFWKRVGTAKRSPTLAELDWASSMIDNILKFFYFRYWRKHLTLVALAILFW